MKVEKLTRSEKDPNKFAAEFENGDKLAVTVAHIADFSLYSGRELQDEAYEALKSAVAADSSKTRALRILGKRNMSRREIIDRLVQKGESEQTAQATADWLCDIGLVNDAEYAAMIVRHYAARGYGRVRIRDELYRRGIEKELWEEAQNALPDMDETAFSVLCAKLKGTRPDKNEMRRVANSLYRRGFSWDEIKPAIERYINEIEDLTQDE